MTTNGSDLERQVLMIVAKALALPEEQRESFVENAAQDNAEVAERVRRLLKIQTQANSHIATGGAKGAVEAFEHPERIGAYKIEELIGQGGMGAVFRGRRDTGDFDHVVAVKIVRPGALSHQLIERFERERQILADLSHPNIARLYDGGTIGDGSPFIVMEYIEGMPITEWADKENLDLGERLSLFELVCAVVRFAHQNLIIHRDLTPSNILVTEDGEPKLIDFGISRPHEIDSNRAMETDAINQSMTPGFAAPERQSGAPPTTLTDVYSLGKLLDVLAEPLSANAELDAIAARASAADPDERYRSTDALIDDIQRLRDGRPVAARDGGRRYVFKKFLQKQRYAVTAGAVILVLLIGGLTATSIGFQQAREAQAEADARFDDVRQIANTLLFDIYDKVDEIPGSTAARQLLAETAQSYLDALAANPNAPAEVRLEAGLGYMRLAHVMGGVGGGNLGLRDEAMANYERADTILTRLHDDQPDNEEFALALAELRYHRSNTMVHITDDYQRGIEFARSVRTVLDRGCNNSPQCTLLRAQSYNAEGQNLYWAEEFDASIRAFDQAIALIASLDGTNSRSEEAVRAAAAAYRFRGDATYFLDDAPGSVREYDRAVRLLERGIARGLDGPDMQRDLAIVEWTRGGSLSEIEEHDAAVAALSRSYEIMERLVEADADDAGSLRLLAVIGGQRGLTLATAGRYAEAVPAAEASLAIRRRLSREQPDESGFFRDVAIQLEGLGNIHAQAGNTVGACDYYRATIDQFDELDGRWGMADFDRNDTYARAAQALRNC